VLICRIVTGLCLAVVFPCLHGILGSWIPRAERSWAVTFVWSGSTIATVVINAVAPIVIRKWGWPYIFYSTGGLGVVWFILWMLFTASKPEEIPTNYVFKHITKYELNLILSNREAKQISSNVIPWGRFFTSTPFWALIIIHVCNNWGFYILLMWLPTYLKENLHYDLEKSGLFSVAPHLIGMAVSNGAGFSASMLIRRRLASVTLIRKVMQCNSFLTTALFLVLISFTHPTNTQAVIYLFLSMTISSTSVAGYGVNHLDLSPRYAGILMGITNTAATLPGIVGVYITGIILDNTNNNWAIVFTLTAGINVFGSIIWIIFASGEPVDFDKPQ